MEPCETRGAMGLASSASQPSVAAAMVLSYLMITRAARKITWKIYIKIEAHSSQRRHHFAKGRSTRL